MTSTEIKKRLTEIALNGSSGREIAYVVIDLLDWVQGGDPACQHDWVYSLLPQHWRCSKCTAQSHAAPTDAKPQPSEEVLAEGVCTTVCIVSSLFHPFTDPFVPLVFRPGDRIKLVRESAVRHGESETGKDGV